MAVYQLSTRIKSNVPASSLLYDLVIYRMDDQRNKKLIVDVQQQSLNVDYSTKQHSTSDIDDPLTTIYIMEVTLYRQLMLKMICVTLTPFTKMYTLKEFASGKAFSPVKRENPCYFESQGTMKPESQGGEIKRLQISRPERPFIAKEYPIGNPQDPFEKTRIYRDIEDRFYRRSFPNQNQTSVCGPAAFFYCLQKDRPDVYKQAALDLWSYGKTAIAGLEIAPSNGCRHPGGDFYGVYGETVSGLDWMTLAGLRDSENAIFSFDAIDSPVAGITMWQTLSDWFEKTGYEKVFSNVGIAQAGLQGLRDLNSYVEKGYKVVTLIDDSLLRGSNSERSTIPKHWIVWEGPVTQGEDGSVHLNLFSWGDVTDRIKIGKDLTFFIKRFFGGMVFKPLK
ncbi:hypothetical protein ICE59_001916 [Salmonella enterica subsp. enterica serovar Agama]|nr:hypothetical protein [Salmonella enterica subsp. enterica serovar Agama]